MILSSKGKKTERSPEGNRSLFLLPPTHRALCRMVHIHHDINQEIVEEMDENRRRQAVGEHDVEQEHSCEPGVDPSEPPLIRMPVPEPAVATDDCGTHYPSMTAIENRL